MTALSEFQRLEAQGSWRESPDARLREVVVSFGDATLMLSDPKSDTPLSHWSLPAVTRLNPGKSPAIFSPGPDDRDETVRLPVQTPGADTPRPSPRPEDAATSATGQEQQDTTPAP
jgi:hypothetical protein